jgi:hypothetical protein
MSAALAFTNANARILDVTERHQLGAARPIGRGLSAEIIVHLGICETATSALGSEAENIGLKLPDPGGHFLGSFAACVRVAPASMGHRPE